VKRLLDEEMFKLQRARLIQRGADAASVTIPEWRLHDIRRTGATNLQALGIPIEVTEAVLNHISGTRAGVAGIYNRHRYDEEKRAALCAWDERISALLAQAGSFSRLTIST
jgi:hypothetical protein